jgi:hypothetical protein
MLFSRINHSEFLALTQQYSKSDCFWGKLSECNNIFVTYSSGNLTVLVTAVNLWNVTTYPPSVGEGGLVGVIGKVENLWAVLGLLV